MRRERGISGSQKERFLVPRNDTLVQRSRKSLALRRLYLRERFLRLGWRLTRCLSAARRASERLLRGRVLVRRGGRHPRLPARVGSLPDGKVLRDAFPLKESQPFFENMIANHGKIKKLDSPRGQEC